MEIEKTVFIIKIRIRQYLALIRQDKMNIYLDDNNIPSTRWDTTNKQTNFFALHYGVLLTTMHLRYWKHFSAHIQSGRLIWCALNRTCIHSIVTEPLCSQLHSFIVCVSYKYMDSETIAFSAVQSVLHSHTYTRVHNPIRKYTRLEFVDFFERFSSKPFSIEKHLGN